ncbi:MAG: hypothetical protein Q4D36_09465 [Bacteroidales bacterium]|nr:hypothetical protein [Bacteroidales bacterium]
MTNKKYDYSEDVLQSAEATSETAKTAEATSITSEEARRQRLEQRNDALANEFRKLKPEIADAHKNLESLIKKLEAFTGTMINLHDLLKTSFPIRLAENDRQALQEEINAIADNAISRIHKEREMAGNDICRNNNRISMTQTTFWCMIALLLILVSFFTLVIFANVKQLHSEILSKIIIVYVCLTAIIFLITGYICYKYNR